jgi:hypothetical protein
MHRIVEVGGLDHVVLFVAAQSMLRTEGDTEPNVREFRERIK